MQNINVTFFVSAEPDSFSTYPVKMRKEIWNITGTFFVLAVPDSSSTYPAKMKNRSDLYNEAMVSVHF